MSVDQGELSPVPPRETWRVRRNLEIILALLVEHGQKATFFMLGFRGRKRSGFSANDLFSRA